MPVNRIRNKIVIIPNKEQKINSIDDIVNRIKRLHTCNALVPVICEDMYEYINPTTQTHQSLHSYLVEKVIDSLYKKGVKIYLTETELHDIVNKGYYGISLLKEKVGREIYEEICCAVLDDESNINEGICLKQEVRDFLNACDFPLIITTSCYPIIETELDNYNSYWCELEQRNETQLPEKCVYHIFGESKLTNPNWGYNDKQLLRFLKNIYTNDYSLKNLTATINNGTSKKVLFVMGNHAPDWLFRFILTPIYGGDIYDDGKGFYMNDDIRNDENELSQFLRDIKFEKETQLLEVLKNATKKIQKKVQIIANSNHNMKYDFFIAHASEDKDIAEKLVNCMRKNGLNIWVDYENIKDGKYWTRIIDAMKNSAYFMPLISEKYILKTKDKTTRDNAILSCGKTQINFEMTDCLLLENFLDGVQIELLLAEKWLEINAKEVYSIPVIIKDSNFFYEPITPNRVSKWGENSRQLPQSLFWGVQMYEFEKDAPQSFSLEWSRYKTLL